MKPTEQAARRRARRPSNRSTRTCQGLQRRRMQMRNTGLSSTSPRVRVPSRPPGRATAGSISSSTTVRRCDLATVDDDRSARALGSMRCRRGAPGEAQFGATPRVDDFEFDAGRASCWEHERWAEARRVRTRARGAVSWIRRREECSIRRGSCTSPSSGTPSTVWTTCGPSTSRRRVPVADAPVRTAEARLDELHPLKGQRGSDFMPSARLPPFPNNLEPLEVPKDRSYSRQVASSSRIQAGVLATPWS